jgi:hypothetical protein
LLLAISALESWDIQALNVKTAFLYGELEEEIYMEQPEGFLVKGQEHKVYHLKRALYGLKQASHAWNKQANKSLKELGFKRCISDSGIYVRYKEQTTTICVLYVDDILFMGSNSQELKLVKESFMKRWECRDLGDVKEYLRMRINYNKNLKTLVIDQEDYSLKVVRRFGQENAKPVRTPLPSGYTPMQHDKEATPQQRTYYQSIIGSLLYLALGTRPDIAFAVICMSQFCANPSEDHIAKALYIVRYVNSTLQAKIVYKGAAQQGLLAFADADWAGDKISRKSVTGYVVMLAGGAVTWTSRKQKTIALSSTKSEYMCMSDACHQLVWIESLLQELSFPVTNIDLCCDNQGAIFLASNPVQEHRSKHIDIRYHYIRECVEEKKISLTYIPTNDQIADIMTKNLNYNKFKFFRESLNVVFDELQSSTKINQTIRSKPYRKKWFEEYLQSKIDHNREQDDENLRWCLSKIKDKKMQDRLRKVINGLRIDRDSKDFKGTSKEFFEEHKDLFIKKDSKVG